MFNFLNNIGTTELLVIGFIILLFFGGKLIKDFAKGIGESAKEVKKLKKTIKEEENE